MTRREFRARLKALGWRQASAAKYLRVHESAVSRWLSGDNPIPGLVVVALDAATSGSVEQARLGRPKARKDAV